MRKRLNKLTLQGIVLCKNTGGYYEKIKKKFSGST